jgi:glycosyltransferase involved in cell wall biosynthesis
MRILLLSPYDADSHRRWRQGLVAAFADMDWSVLALPARYFAWRIRGNSLSWGLGEEQVLTQPFDLLVATSMTDLSALKGLVPSLAGVPSLLYCHENQFAYPQRRDNPGNDPKVVNLYAALAADRVIFNTEYNRSSFLQGVASFLALMPDAVPPAVVDRLRAKSTVIPVPLETTWLGAQESTLVTHRPFTIVWNHRWEYDKGPERLSAALLALQAAGVDFRVHVIGRPFRTIPPSFEQLRIQLGSRIGYWGRVESRSEYRRILQGSDLVLSTALHEFQGMAVLEAVACGCVPLVPDRLAYTELFGTEFRYASFPGAADAEVAVLVRRLRQLADSYLQGTLPSPPDVRAFTWQQLRPAYAAELSSLSACRSFKRP